MPVTVDPAVGEVAGNTGNINITGVGVSVRKTHCKVLAGFIVKAYVVAVIFDIEIRIIINTIIIGI